MATNRPTDSGRKDSLGRAIKVADTDVETRASAPAPTLAPDSAAVEDMYDRFLVEFGRQHGVTVITASNEHDAGRPSCRCCIDTPDSGDVLVLAGGAETSSTEQWVSSGGFASWSGDPDAISAMLTAAGIDHEPPESPAKTFVLNPSDATMADAARWERFNLCPKCGERSDNGVVCGDCVATCEWCGTEIEDGETLCHLCESRHDDDDDEDDDDDY